MGKCLRDIGYAFFLAVVIYLPADVAGQKINQFLVKDPINRFVLIAVVVIFSIFIGYGLATFLKKWIWSVYKIGYQSSNVVISLFGIAISILLMNVHLPDPDIFIFQYALILFLYVSCLSGLCCALANALLEKKTEDNIGVFAEDKLDRRRFVNKVVSLLEKPDDLVSKSDNEALVIWIASRWGTGKTWCLDQIQRSFKSKNNNDTVVWFSFSPWLHSSPEPERDLVDAFFSQLSDEISKKFYLDRPNDHIESYMKSILSKGSEKVLGIDSDVFRSTSETTEDLKNSISEFLREKHIRLIITFDEIDRLMPKEMVTCLRLVRSLANFGNAVILVCGDSDKVEELLKNAQLPNGYLEKIAHVPLSLPLINANMRVDILWEYIGGDGLEDDLKNLLMKAIKGLLPSGYYRSLRKNPSSLISNLRVIKRLADTIKLDLFLKEKWREVNIQDFLYIQLIRLNCFPLYEEIKNNRSLWVGEVLSNSHQNHDNQASCKQAEKLIECVLNKLDDVSMKEPIREIIKEMNTVFRSNSSEMFSLHHCGGKQRLYEEDFFDRYFVEGLPSGQIQQLKIREIIEAWKGFGNIEDALSGLKNEDIAWLFREIVTNYQEELKVSIKKKIMKFLIDQRVDRSIRYQTGSYRADPEDFNLPTGVDHREIVEHYLSKCGEVNEVFFDASQYMNKMWWDVRRRGIDGITKEDTSMLSALIEEKFKEYFLDRGKSFLSLPPYIIYKMDNLWYK